MRSKRRKPTVSQRLESFFFFFFFFPLFGIWTNRVRDEIRDEIKREMDTDSLTRPDQTRPDLGEVGAEIPGLKLHTGVLMYMYSIVVFIR